MRTNLRVAAAIICSTPLFLFPRWWQPIYRGKLCATHSLDTAVTVVVAVDVLGAATQLGWMWWGGCSCWGWWLVWATLAADGDHTLDTGGHILAVTGNTDTGTRQADDDIWYLLKHKVVQKLFQLCVCCPSNRFIMENKGCWILLHNVSR